MECMPPVKGQGSDPYRCYMSLETEKDTIWKTPTGDPPSFDAVNDLCERERTNKWEKGSLEDRVECLIKTWEMELGYKPRLQDMKTLDPHKFCASVNGKRELTLAEIAERGGYNVFLESRLAQMRECYDAWAHTAEESGNIFKGVFPGGLALEVLHVYSGPPVICYKFRHWGHMTGPFLNHSPSNAIAQFIGISIAWLDESGKIVKMEHFYDPAEFLGDLVQLDPSSKNAVAAAKCPALP